MQKSKTYLIIVAIFLTMNSCLMNDITGQAKIVIDQAEKEFDNVANLVVKGSFCNVNVNSHGTNSIMFKGEVKANKDRDDIKIKYKQDGATLEVWIERPNSLRGSFKGVLDFKVPESTNIKVKNSSGSVYVANIGQSVVDLIASSGSVKAENVDTDVRITTSSGSVKAINIGGNLTTISSSGSQFLTKIGGEAKATCSSGSIKMENVNGDVSSKSSSGSQSLAAIHGNVKAAASSGSLNISSIKGDVTARSSSGSIKLANVKGALELSSSSGGQYGEEIHLTGNSSFKSSSGSIKMEIINSTDELSFNLTASSGGLQAKGANGKKKLLIERGDILITGISSSGRQQYN